MILDNCFRPAHLLLLSGLMLGASHPAWADPPGRVARVSYLGGEVSFAPAGEDSWYAARLNRPLVTGDRLWTGRGGRAELELGTAVVRLDEGTSFEFLTLDDQIAQIQLTEGTINLRVDHLYPGQVYEIDTPTLAFVADQPGEYRLDIAPYAESTQVTVFAGYGDVYGEGGRNVQVQAGMSYRFFDPDLRDYERLARPRGDDFDDWVFARNDRYLNSPTRNYVSNEVIGYADLDDYGSWRSVPDHGHVWFPRHVAAGWAPYRHGRWAWIDPWGWSWIDDSPWGFAPFHYGRWVYVANGWGWVPGPRHVRPVYAPALVAFVGGSGWSLTVSTGGPPVGWFPLGPRDVYVPWYRVSRGYFGRVNVHNTVVINNTYVTNIYNDYYVQGRPLRREYTFRNAVNAVTVVPRDSFVSARSAAESMAHLRPGVLQRGELITGAPATPTRASLATTSARSAMPSARAFDRQVIARTQPAPRVASFETRQRAIARNGGEPLAVDQLNRLNANAAGGRSERVRVIGSDRDAPTAASRTASREPSSRTTAPTRGVVRGVDAQPAPMVGTATRDARDSATTSPRADRSANAATRANGRMNPSPTTGNEAPQTDSRALPSARYAPRTGDRATRSTPSETRELPTPSTRASGERDNGATRTTPSNRSPATQRTPSATARQRGNQTITPTPAPRSRTTIQTPEQTHTPAAPRTERRTTSPSRSEPRSAPAPRAMPRQSAPAVQPRNSAPRETPRAASPRTETRSAPAPRSPPQREQKSERTARDNAPARNERNERDNARGRSSGRER